jgi:hypothetical protein
LPIPLLNFLHGIKHRDCGSAVSPVFVVLGPALFWAHLPEGVVLGDDGGDEVVGLVATLHRERARVRVVEAAVRVVADRVALGPGPDVPEGVFPGTMKNPEHRFLDALRRLVLWQICLKLNYVAKPGNCCPYKIFFFLVSAKIIATDCLLVYCYK